jgi:acyl carrier protein
MLPVPLLVRELLSEALDGTRSAETIKDDERLFIDLGLDSLTYMEVWSALEKRLGRRIDDEDLLGEVRTVADLIAQVERIAADP